MKLLTTWLALALVFATVGHAQQVDFDEVVLPVGSSAKTFEEYAVQRAYVNNVSNRALEGQVAISDLEIKQAKRSWLDQVNANLNFSSQEQEFIGPFNLGGENANTFVGPGYNYGVSFNVGGLINNKSRVEVARQEKLIAESKRDQEKLQLRAAVKTRLEMRDNAVDVLRIRRLSEIDAETNYQLVRELFEQGKADFEDLAQASEVFHRAVEATAVAESQVRRAEILIEEIVGEPWAELKVVKARMEGE